MKGPMASTSAPSASISIVAPRSTSIISPVVDFLCVGGLSLIVFVPLLLSGGDLSLVSLGAVVWAQLLVNYAHFMALSHRLP